MRSITLITTALSALILISGCASYSFTSKVPAESRSIAVPVFINESNFPELDAVVTQYTLREFQREGTFKIKSVDNASYKLYGTLTEAQPAPLNYDRNFGLRASEYKYQVTALITLVECSTGKMLMNEVPIRANTAFLTHGDMLTGMQDANPRLAKELSQAIVDTVLAQW